MIWPAYEGMTFGEVVSLRRAELGLLQKELAGKIGVSRTVVTQIERGRGEPRNGTRVQFALALGLDPVTLKPNEEATSK